MSMKLVPHGDPRLMSVVPRILNRLGRASSYGMSTTHMNKLLPRIEGGSGAGCPILVIGISERVYTEDC